MPKTATRKPKALPAKPPREKKLSANMLKFIDGYIKHGNQTKAYMDAYPECKSSAWSSAHDLLKKPEIQAEVARRQAQLAKKADITAEMIVNEWAKIGFANILDYITIDEETGHATIDLRNVTRETGAAISEVVTGTDKSGNAYTKIKLHPKDPALEKLAKKLGLLKDEAPNLTLNFGFAGNAGLALMDDAELQAIIALRLKGGKR